MLEMSIEMSKPNILSLFFPLDCRLDVVTSLVLILVKCTRLEIMF